MPSVERDPPMKGMVWWLIGIPIPVIVFLYLFGIMG